jgi:hypothetical protein
LDGSCSWSLQGSGSVIRLLFSLRNDMIWCEYTGFTNGKDPDLITTLADFHHVLESALTEARLKPSLNYATASLIVAFDTWLVMR